MSFQWTAQQEQLFTTVAAATQASTPSVITTNAVAGSSKSSSAVEAVRRIKEANPATTIRYLVFGSLASQEAKLDFGHTATVSTLHSLAYFYEMTHSSPKRFLPRNRPYVSWQDIPRDIKRPFGIDFEAIQLVDAYCNSEFTSLKMYITDQFDNAGNEIRPYVARLANDLLNAMYVGRMPCTHAFYLKIFHINLLNNLIQLPQTDLLIIDEAQDLSSITVEILRKFPAKVKLLIGDKYQSIFAWMGCINAFDLYPDSTKLQLTQSFRVNHIDAKSVQSFMRSTVDKSFDFIGRVYDTPIPSNPTTAYLTRTNAALITKMVELDANNIPYHLATTGKIDQMFKLPLDIAHIKPGTELKRADPLYDVQHAVNEWASSEKLQEKYTSKYSYLLSTHKNNPEVHNAVKLVVQYSYDKLKQTAVNAKAHTKSTASLSLMTVHTSKGATRDVVELADDVNVSIEGAVAKIEAGVLLNKEDIESIYIYYVAVTRHRHKILNAKYLNTYIGPINDA